MPSPSNVRLLPTTTLIPNRGFNCVASLQIAFVNVRPRHVLLVRGNPCSDCQFEGSITVRLGLMRSYHPRQQVRPDDKSESFTSFTIWKSRRIFAWHGHGKTRQKYCRLRSSSTLSNYPSIAMSASSRPRWTRRFLRRFFSAVAPDR